MNIEKKYSTRDILTTTTIYDINSNNNNKFKSCLNYMEKIFF